MSYPEYFIQTNSEEKVIVKASIYVNLLRPSVFFCSVILSASAFRCFTKRQQGEKKKKTLV